MSRVIYYSGWLSPELCQEHPDKRFIFGDNLQRFGMGGQAIIRYEQNAIGVPTKRAPSMARSAFFARDNETDLASVLVALGNLWAALKGGATLVVPVTKSGKVSLGLERAELEERAPEIYETIVMHIKEMANVYGGTNVLERL